MRQWKEPIGLIQENRNTKTFCYLSLTSLSLKGFLGLRFIISDSASSYASEMAGTWSRPNKYMSKTKSQEGRPWGANTYMPALFLDLPSLDLVCQVSMFVWQVFFIVGTLFVIYYNITLFLNYFIILYHTYYVKHFLW